MTTAATIRPAWQCQGCGKIANSVARPRSHRRAGDACGPFEAATVAPDGMVLAPADAVTSHSPSSQVDVNDPLRYRQSTLRAYMECPRRVVMSSGLTTGGIGSSADLGSAFHAVAAEYLRTLRRHGETQASTEEVVCIAREVVAAGSWVLTPSAYMRLIEMVCNLAGEVWNPARFMAIEQRLSMDVLCPDGELRLLTGTPDLVIADPGNPPGAICVDHKTGLSKPQTPREPVPDGEPIRGEQYLSDGGFAQLSIYGCLLMHEWPRIQQVTLREKSWRWPGPPREATMSRADLEHVVPYLGVLMMQVDRALREGEGSQFAQPRPGRQCASRCSVSRSCGVPQEQRGLGALDSPDAADAEAARWEVITALGKQQREALKAFHEETEYRPRLPDGRVVGWKAKPDGKGRAFGAHTVEAVERAATVVADDTFMQQWADELAFQQAKAGVA